MPRHSLLAAIAGSALMLSGASALAQGGLKTAVFAGGCFWSMEKALEHVPGVTNAVSGYAGGTRQRPTYQNHTGHLEAVKVTYDPARISYAKLVDTYFHNIDPTDPNGQICDYGPAYRTAVFVSDTAEQQTAQAVKAQIGKTLGRPVATMILPASQFWMAEGYHQDYAQKNPDAYADYRMRCGRDRGLKAVWGAR